MELFGIHKAIEYIEREISDLSFKNSKEEIRYHGTNVLVLTENVLREMVYIYGYIFFNSDFKNGLKEIINLDDKTMFGTLIFSLNKMHIFLKDKNLNKAFAKYFNRNFVVFKYQDKYFNMLVECSRIRAMLLHDDVKNIYKLNEYMEKTMDGLNKTLEVLKYFKENSMFPSLVELKNHVVENDITILNFSDEINSTIPLLMGNDVNKYGGTKWYFFKASKTNVLIPVINDINPLSNKAINFSNGISINNSEELTIEPLGYLKVDKLNQEIPIINGIINIGRSDENDISFKKMSISRRHCILLIKEKIYLTDLNSKYGTFLNRTRLLPNKRYEVKQNDKISIGLATEEIVITYCI